MTEAEKLLYELAKLIDKRAATAHKNDLLEAENALLNVSGAIYALLMERDPEERVSLW